MHLILRFSIFIRNKNPDQNKNSFHAWTSLPNDFNFQASGVAVSEDVKVKYDEIKKKKTHRYLVFFIKDEKTIAVEKVGEF